MAAVDYFLKIDGTNFDVNATIEIESFSWGASQSSSIGSGTGGAGAGKVSISDFNCTRVMDKWSPAMLAACCAGQHIKTATLYCRKAGSTQPDFTWKLQDCLVSSFADAGNRHGDVFPLESVSFNFTKIEYIVGPTGVDVTNDPASGVTADFFIVQTPT